MAAETKPTIVLVHGAFADASGWSDVSRGLRERGFPVYAPANPLRGIFSDGDYIRAFVSTIEGPVVRKHPTSLTATRSDVDRSRPSLTISPLSNTNRLTPDHPDAKTGSTGIPARRANSRRPSTCRGPSEKSSVRK